METRLINNCEFVIFTTGEKQIGKTLAMLKKIADIKDNGKTVHIVVPSEKNKNDQDNTK